MANTIKLGYSNTSGQTPDTLAGGEVGINTSNRKVWVGNGTGNTLVFNHADYAPATANASESYVTSRGYLTAVSGSSYFAPKTGTASESYVTTQINNLIDAAPGALNTLNELAASIGDDANYATTVTNALAGKSSTSHNHNTAYLGISSKAADSNLLDGVDSLKYLKGYGNVSGWQNSNANFSIRSGSASVGLHMEGSSGEFGFQLYSSGSTYGFLDAEWGGWDIRKTENGNFEVDEGSGLKRVWNAGNVSAGTGISISGQTITNTVTQLSDTQVRSKFTGGVGIAMDSSGVLSTALSELPDMTASLWPPDDEFIVLDAGVQKRKRATEIFGNHAFGAVDTTVTSTSTTAAASASSVKAAYDRAWMPASTTLGDLGYYGHPNANSYSHPLGNGNRHMPSNGSTGQILKNTGAGNASWQAETDTIYTHPTGNGNSHIPADGSSGQFLKYSSAGVATWGADNTGVTSVTAGYGLAGGVITASGTVSHSIANGFAHIPPSGSSGKFLQWSGTGQASWVSDIVIAEAARAQMGVAPGPSGTPGLTDVNFTSTLKTKLDGLSQITNNNQLTNGAAYITAAGNTQLTDTQVRSKFTAGVGIAMDSSGVLSTALNELGDHTPSLFPPTDEFIILANGAQKRKLGSEIFGNHCFAQANNTVTSTSSTQAASAGSVKTAYDLAASKSDAPNNAQANVGIQFNGATAGSGMNVNAGYISHYSGTPFNHIPANGTSGQVLGWASSGTAQWVAASSGGTTTWNGLENISNLTALP